jgi:hypothetical protein
MTDRRTELREELQRLNPLRDPERHMALFVEFVELEALEQAKNDHPSGKSLETSRGD